MADLPDKESVEFTVSFIKDNPLVSSILSAIGGSVLTYVGFWKGFISIPSQTAKMAKLEADNENHAERIQLLIDSNTKNKLKVENAEAEMRRRLSEFEKKQSS